MTDESKPRKTVFAPSAPREVNREFRNQQDQEPEDGKHSNLDPRNQFHPKVRILPKPKLTGVSVGFTLPLAGLVRYFSKEARQERRLKKAVAKHQERQNQTRTRR